MSSETTPAAEPAEDDASSFFSTVEELHPTPKWAQTVLITVWTFTLGFFIIYNAIVVVMWYKKRKLEESQKPRQATSNNRQTPKFPPSDKKANPVFKELIQSSNVSPGSSAENAAKPRAGLELVASGKNPEQSKQRNETPVSGHGDPSVKHEDPPPKSITQSAFGNVVLSEVLKEKQSHLTSEQEREIIKQQKPPADQAEFLEMAKKQYDNLPSDMREAMHPSKLLLNYIEKKEAERLEAEKKAERMAKQHETPSEKSTSKQDKGETSNVSKKG